MGEREVKGASSSFQRGTVWRIQFDPIRGREQAGFRYGVILSPDSLNLALDIVIVAPLTTKMKDWPTRVSSRFKDVDGQIQCEQIRVVSKTRLKEHVGNLLIEEMAKVRLVLKQMLVEE